MQRKILRSNHKNNGKRGNEVREKRQGNQRSLLHCSFSSRLPAVPFVIFLLCTTPHRSCELLDRGPHTRQRHLPRLGPSSGGSRHERDAPALLLNVRGADRYHVGVPPFFSLNGEWVGGGGDGNEWLWWWVVVEVVIPSSKWVK